MNAFGGDGFKIERLLGYIVNTAQMFLNGTPIYQ